MKTFKRIATAAAAAALLAALPAQAFTVSVIEANGNAVDTTFSSPTMLSVQYGLSNQSPVVLGMTLESGDPATLPFNALVDNLLFLGFQQVKFTLTGTTFTTLGTASGSFGSVATVSGGGALANIGLAPPENFAVYVGDWLLDGSNEDFFISLAGADGPITLTAQAVVPEPGTYALLLAGLAVLGFTARRRR